LSGAFPSARRLGRAFYDRPTLEVAQDLVGCILVLREGRHVSALRLVEVEAYLGGGRDPACHAHRGRTARNAELFETPGRLYVYFIYGMHHCMNAVCEPKGVAGAVLLRAGEPVAGLDRMVARRGRGGREISNGPAKMCSALGIDLAWNGKDLVKGTLGIWPGRPPAKVARSGRIGIRLAAELPYRYFDPDSPFVSPGRHAATYDL
jgi:DNA-3-methyladenine glycosylase